VELLRGITGFRHMDDAPLPTSDVAAFRTHCFTAARLLSGRVSRIESPSDTTGQNFVSVVLELPEGRVAVLLNAHYPVVGFAEPLRESDRQLQFVDIPRLVEVFRNLGVYRVLEASDLEGSATGVDSSQLGPAELEQIRYWKPTRVGDLVFNFWD
jgi:hypothetical protein